MKEDIALKCNGDLKQALNQLYLMSLSVKGRKGERVFRKIKGIATQNSQKIIASQNTNQEEVTHFKDREFNLFHTLGKFLYNKSKRV